MAELVVVGSLVGGYKLKELCLEVAMQNDNHVPTHFLQYDGTHL